MTTRYRKKCDHLAQRDLVGGEKSGDRLNEMTDHDAVTDRANGKISKQKADWPTMPQGISRSQEKPSPDNTYAMRNLRACSW